MSLPKRFPLLLAAFLCLCLADTSSVHATTQQLFVRTDGSDTTCNGSANLSATSAPNCAFKTINKAVSVAPVGAKIKVGPGSFPEQLTIYQDLTIEGAGQTQTSIIVPAVPVPNVPSPTDPSPPTLANGYALVAVVASTVSLSNITLSGPWPFPGNCAPQFYGVFVYASGTLNISRSTIANILNTGTNAYGCQQGVGIGVGRASLNLAGHATIDRVTIYGYQKNGVVFSGNGTTGSIKSSTVKGAGPGTLLAQSIAQNGIQVSFGAVVDVVNNTVTNNVCDLTPVCGPDPLNQTQSVGILLFDAESGSYLIGNTTTNNDIGIYFHSRGGLTIASNNTVRGNRFVQVFADQGTALLFGNEIRGGTYGLFAAAFDGNTENTNVYVAGGSIGQSSQPVVIADQAPEPITVNLEIDTSTRCDASCAPYRSPRHPGHRRHNPND